ncbi:ABC transporter ATP-binding protein [Rhodopseudomonas palustris]|uniref:ABC transporter related n=1 Tax=Rhodopseudomonas palustris (strain BisB18) TaxID=316056 RepID=Q20YK7_RHOPB
MTATAFLAIERLCVRLGGRVLVDDVSVALPRRCLVALVGPNGAGKTTLLRALAGLVPSQGQVTIDGKDLAGLAVRERAVRFAYLPQGHAVHWPLPVRDVVALGRYPHGATDPRRLGPSDAAAVDRALHEADLMALQDRPVSELSGGERGRVALARALATQAPVLLADEPIASLDPYYQLSVMALLRKQADAGALVVVVTHDLGLAARFADRVLTLRDGRLSNAGAPDVALSADRLAEIFAIEAFRGVHDGQPVIVPWAAR